MARESTRRRSRDSSRKRRRDRERDRDRDVIGRRESRDYAGNNNIATGTSYPSYTADVPRSTRRRRSGSSSASSYTSSSASSLLDISRSTNTRKYGGVIGAFFRAPSERRRRARRTSARTQRRGFFASGGGNSSSSSVNSDLAYGTGYIPKVKGSSQYDSASNTRDFQRSRDAGIGGPSVSGPPRSKTDEEIIEIGRQLSDLAKKQNKSDLRAGGYVKPGALLGAAAAYSAYRNKKKDKNRDPNARGIGSSKPHGQYSSDEEDWESASEDESDADSVLAFGTGSALGVNTSGGSKWAPAAAGAALGGVAAFAMGKNRNNAAVDPSLFGPVNSLHGMVTPLGFDHPDAKIDPRYRNAIDERRRESDPYDKNAPMRHVYPMPTDDPDRYSTISSHKPIPLQQPKPITPVSSKVYNADRLEDSTRHDSSRREKRDRDERDDRDKHDSKYMSGAAVAGIAAAAVGAAALASSKDDSRKEKRSSRDYDDRDRRDKEYEREKDREQRRRERDAEKDKERRRSKRDSTGSKYDDDRDRDRDHKRHSKYDDQEDAPRKRRETEESSRKSKSRGDRDEYEMRSEVSRSSRRDSDKYSSKDARKEERREERRRERAEAAGPSEERQLVHRSASGAMDPFQYQVDPGSFAQLPGTSQPLGLPAVPDRPLTPNIIDALDEEPNFTSDEDNNKMPVPSGSRLSRKDSFEIEREAEERSSRSDPKGKGKAREYDDDRHDSFYDDVKRAAVPIAAGAAVAAIAASAGSRKRDKSPNGSYRKRDTVQEEADRYYREANQARKEEEEHIRSATPDRSVINKFEGDDGAQDDIKIVTPPEMENHVTNRYDGPNADVRIDNEIFPHDLRRYQLKDSSKKSNFKSRDPSCERERPMLNLVYPTPSQTPSPEKQSSSDKNRDEPSDRSRDEPKDKSRDVDDDYSPTKSDVQSNVSSKSVSWGENSTKQFVVESPSMNSDIEVHEDKEAVNDKQSSPKDKPRSKLNKTSQWGIIAAAIAGSSAEPKNELENDQPPVPGPKPTSAAKGTMPGGFGDDIEFAATIAAGLKDSGFDSNIAIDDPKYRRRDSPPGERDANGDEWSHKSAFTEPAAEDEWESTKKLSKKEKKKLDKLKRQSGDFTDDGPAESSATATADDEVTENGTKLSKKEQKKLDKLRRQSGEFDDDTPFTPTRDSVLDDISATLNKKEKKKQERLKRQSGDFSDAAAAIAVAAAVIPSETSREMSFEDVADDISKLSKKEQKKLDKLKKADELDDLKRSDSVDTMTFEDAVENVSGLSKKELKKLEKKKRQSGDFTDLPRTDSPDNMTFEDAVEAAPKLTKKEQKKLDKLKRQSGDFSDSVKTESPDALTFEEAGEDLSKLSKKEKKKREKAEKSRALQQEDAPLDWADEVEQAAAGAATIEAADAAWEESASSKKKKKKTKSRDLDDLPTETFDEPRKIDEDDDWTTSSKSKRKSTSEYDLSTTKSDVSSSSKKSSKSKRRSLNDDDFAKYEDEASESKRHVFDDNDVTSVVSESRRTRRSKYDDDDARSVVSAPGGDRKGKESSKKSSGIFSGIFKSSSKEDDKKESFLDNAGTLGAGVGLAGAAAIIAASVSRSNAAHESSDKDDIAITSRDEAASYDNDTVDPEVAARVFKPAIDPQYGDLLPLPPSTPGSPKAGPEDNLELPALPDSRPDTPPEERNLKREQVTSHRRRRSTQDNINTTKSPSRTAIPISLRLGGQRSSPSSPNLAFRSPPLGSPSPATPESISKRNRTSWDSSREIKPLYLLEQSRQMPADTASQEDLPALPPSEPSEASFREGSELEFHDVVQDDDIGDPVSMATTGLRIRTPTSADFAEVAGSQESTPKAEVRPVFPDPEPAESTSKNRSSYLLNSTPDSAKSSKLAEVDSFQSPTDSTPSKRLHVDNLPEIHEDLTSADEHFSDAVEMHEAESRRASVDSIAQHAHALPDVTAAEPDDQATPVIGSAPEVTEKQVIEDKPIEKQVLDDEEPEEWAGLSAKQKKKLKKARKNQALDWSDLAPAAAAAGAAGVAAVIAAEAIKDEPTPAEDEFEVPKKGKKGKKNKKQPFAWDEVEPAVEPVVEPESVPVEKENVPEPELEPISADKEIVSEPEPISSTEDIVPEPTEPLADIDAAPAAEPVADDLWDVPKSKKDKKKKKRQSMDVFEAEQAEKPEPEPATKELIEEPQSMVEPAKPVEVVDEWDALVKPEVPREAEALPEDEFAPVASKKKGKKSKRKSVQWDDVDTAEPAAVTPTAPASDAKPYFPSSAALHSPMESPKQDAESTAYFPSAHRILPALVATAGAGAIAAELLTDKPKDAALDDNDGSKDNAKTLEPDEAISEPLFTQDSIPDFSQDGTASIDITQAEESAVVPESEWSEAASGSKKNKGKKNKTNVWDLVEEAATEPAIEEDKSKELPLDVVEAAPIEAVDAPAVEPEDEWSMPSKKSKKAKKKAARLALWDDVADAPEPTPEAPIDVAEKSDEIAADDISTEPSSEPAAEPITEAVAETPLEPLADKEPQPADDDFFPVKLSKKDKKKKKKQQALDWLDEPSPAPEDIAVEEKAVEAPVAEEAIKEEIATEAPPLEELPTESMTTDIVAEEAPPTEAAPQEVAAEDEWFTSSKKDKKNKKKKKGMSFAFEPELEQPETVEETTKAVEEESRDITADVEKDLPVDIVEPEVELKPSTVAEDTKDDIVVEEEPATEPKDEGPDDDSWGFGLSKKEKKKLKKKGLIGAAAAVGAAALVAEVTKDDEKEPSASEVVEEPVPVVEADPDAMEWAPTKKSKKDKKKDKRLSLAEPAVADEEPIEKSIEEPVEATKDEAPLKEVTKLVDEPTVVEESAAAAEPTIVDEPATEPAPADEDWGFTVKPSKKDKKKKKRLSELQTSEDPEPIVEVVPEPSAEPVEVAETPMELQDETLDASKDLEVEPTAELAPEPVAEVAPEANMDDEWGFTVKKKKGKKGKKGSGAQTPSEPVEAPVEPEIVEPEIVEPVVEPSEPTETVNEPVGEDVDFGLETSRDAPVEPAADDDFWTLPAKKSKKKGKKGKSIDILDEPAPVDVAVTSETTPPASEPITATLTEEPESIEAEQLPAAEPVVEDEWAMPTKKGKKGKKKSKSLSAWDDEPVVEAEPKDPIEASDTAEPSLPVEEVAPVDDDWSAPVSKKKSKKDKKKSFSAWDEPEPAEEHVKEVTAAPEAELEPIIVEDDQPTPADSTEATEAAADDVWAVPGSKKKAKKAKKKALSMSAFDDPIPDEPTTSAAPDEAQDDDWDTPVTKKSKKDKKRQSAPEPDTKAAAAAAGADIWDDDDFFTKNDNSPPMENEDDDVARRDNEEPRHDNELSDKRATSIDEEKAVEHLPMVEPDDVAPLTDDHHATNTRDLTPPEEPITSSSSGVNAVEAAAAAAALTGGVAMLTDKLSGKKKSKKDKKKKIVDKRTPTEDDIFDDPALWEGAEKKTTSGRYAEDSEAFWGGGEERSETPRAVESLPTPASDNATTDSESGWKETARQGVSVDSDYKESPVLGRGESDFSLTGPSELLHRDSPTRELSGLLLQEQPRAMGSEYSEFRTSPTRSLPAVQEYPDIEGEAISTPTKWASPEMSRDSGYMPGSPHSNRRRSPRRSQEVQMHRDSGVHSGEWTDRDARAEASMRTPEPRERKLRYSPSGTPVLREPSPARELHDDPEKRSTPAASSSSSKSKSYGAVGAAASAVKSRYGGTERGLEPIDTNFDSGRRSVSDRGPLPHKSSASDLDALGRPAAAMRSASGSSLARQRTPEPLRLQPDGSGIHSASAGSGTTPPSLRRVDKKMSGDLRALQRQQNNATPITANEGRVRSRDMADVYVSIA